MRIAHASASEVGKVSTPRGTPLQRVAGGWKHRGRQVVTAVLINLGKNSLRGV